MKRIKIIFVWRNLKFILVFILQRDHAEPIRLEDGAGYRCPFCLNDFKSHIKRHIRTHTVPNVIVVTDHFF